MFIGLGLGGSSLDAKGGIVGGAIELNKIDTFSEFSFTTNKSLNYAAQFPILPSHNIV